MARPLHIAQIVAALATAAAFGACGGTLSGVSPGAVSPPTVDDSSAPPQSVPPPTTPPMLDVRDRQIDILADAVSALREELGRSYEHSQQLAQEAERLRALVASLRRELDRRRGESKALRNHVRTLEKMLSEIATPAPEAQSPPAAEPTESTAGAGSADQNAARESRRRFSVPSTASPPTDHDAAADPGPPESPTASPAQAQPPGHEGDETLPPEAESE